MPTKSQCATTAIIISSTFLGACSDVEGDKETASVTFETNFNDSSLIEETRWEPPIIRRLPSP